VRKLFIVFAIIAGLFGLQESPAMPLTREKARTEQVFKYQEQKVNVAAAIPTKQSYPFIRETLQRPQVLHPYLLTLLLSSQYHHSSL